MPWSDIAQKKKKKKKKGKREERGGGGGGSFCPSFGECFLQQQHRVGRKKRGEKKKGGGEGGGKVLDVRRSCLKTAFGFLHKRGEKGEKRRGRGKTRAARNAILPSKKVRV